MWAPPCDLAAYIGQSCDELVLPEFLRISLKCGTEKLVEKEIRATRGGGGQKRLGIL